MVSGNRVHARCVEHIKVEGYTKKVCILQGDDPKEVIDFALDIRKIGENRGSN